MALRALTNHPDKYIKMLITIIRDTEKINTVLQSPASVPTFLCLHDLPFSIVILKLYL